MGVKTGIKIIDDVMGDGLNEGGLGVVVTPFSVGKTSFLTKIANTAFSNGNKVLQIVFEDNPKTIQRKHISCFLGVSINDIKAGNMEQFSNIHNLTSEKGGELKIKKMRSFGVTIDEVKGYVLGCIDSGFNPDLIILDYFDCIYTENSDYKAMRSFEILLSDLNIAGWTGLQSRRQSIGSDILDGSDIQKGVNLLNIGQFWVTIAKTMDQKENGKATYNIIKSKFSADGVVFYNIPFNNDLMKFE
jgi:hypothetical protein|tara:strand:- start:18046 stop:18780 length:735 start_codon:yes stop_codon:yes gene_type:complete